MSPNNGEQASSLSDTGEMPVPLMNKKDKVDYSHQIKEVLL